MKLTSKMGNRLSTSMGPLQYAGQNTQFITITKESLQIHFLLFKTTARIDISCRQSIALKNRLNEWCKAINRSEKEAIRAFVY
jgi:hypothetical protein